LGLAFGRFWLLIKTYYTFYMAIGGRKGVDGGGFGTNHQLSAWVVGFAAGLTGHGFLHLKVIFK
jgi:hypothetical protein